MTTLTLVTAAVCLFPFPVLGGYYNNNKGYPGTNPGTYSGANPGAYPGANPGAYPGGNPGTYPGNFPSSFRPYPYPRRGYPSTRSNFGQYVYGPVTALKSRRNDGQQGTDGQGSQGGNDQSQGGQGAKGGSGRKGGRGDDRPNPPDAVAFSGNRRTSQFFFGQGPVIFDDVTTNIGGGYNNDYGVFTAFESGIYVVNYNVVSPRKGVKTAAVDLLRNKEVINSASGRGRSGETSNSAVVFLNRHDQLSVQGRPESAIFCGDGGNDAFCSFNVVLLKMGVFSDSKNPRPVPGW